MNLLARAKLSSSHIIFPYIIPSKCPFSRHPFTAVALHQCNFYSTKKVSSSLKLQKLFKPETLKESSELSTPSLKQTDVPTKVWPKPRQIPYQPKVANFVNLIGHVKIPVRFEAAPDGTHFAATVISQENGNERNSLSIPVVFEGDLAHVVACHVKENDCVFVSGVLSVDPIKVVLSETLGKFHVVAENLNFVEGFKRYVSVKKVEPSVSGVGIQELKERFGRMQNQASAEVAAPLGVQELRERFGRIRNQASAEVAAPLGIQELKERFERMGSQASAKVAAPVVATPEGANGDVEPEKDNGKIVENDSRRKNVNGMSDLWRDLVQHPLQWWDYRGHKSKGLVKEKFPDFKQKVTNESLWISSAPAWVLPGLKSLEFDVKDLKEGAGGSRNDAKKQESWKNLVENPSKWWDNRLRKQNPKAPDFKHKETGEVLWINDSPDWAFSKLPVLVKDVKSSNDGKMEAQCL